MSYGRKKILVEYIAGIKNIAGRIPETTRSAVHNL